MTSTTRRLGLLGLPALLLVAAGCGSSASSTQQGTMSVHLLKAPGDFFTEVDLHILALEAHSNTAGWVTLSEPDDTFDLMQLTGGVVATLASGVALEPGKYTQFRLVLGPGQNDPASGDKISNLVVLNDGTPHDLIVPSGLQSGVKLVCQVDVQPGASVDVFIDFEIPKSIHLHETGTSAKFILRPVIHCRQGPGTLPPPPPSETGLITGQFNGLSTTEIPIPLVGVEVTAQVLDASGKASIVATTTTVGAGDPLGAGAYILAGLPLGATYYVVSQPVMTVGLATFSWEAQASLALPLDAATPTDDFNAFFFSPVPTGNVAGTNPTASPNDVVLVRQVLHPANPIEVIVRAEPVAAGAITFSISDLPLGSYTFELSRLVGASFVSGPSVPVVLTTAGATVPVTLTFP